MERRIFASTTTNNMVLIDVAFFTLACIKARWEHRQWAFEIY
jgi:hypothetical protein